MKKFTTVEEIKNTLVSHERAYNEVTSCLGTDAITEEGKKKMLAISQLRFYVTFCDTIEDLQELIDEDAEATKERGIYEWIEKWMRFNVEVNL